MTYPMCEQTVTVYRKAGDTVCRQVHEGCFYHWQDRLVRAAAGVRLERTFLLIMPGQTQQVFPGDRVLEGVGPEVTAQQWAGFIPVNVPTLSEAEYAKVWRLDGAVCHTEAGR